MRLAHEIAQDARHTFRLWARRPWHTAFAMAALAIGIGANTGVFSVVNALLIRALPFRQPERLAVLEMFYPPHASARQFHEWRKRSTYLADAALVEDADVNLGRPSTTLRVHAAQASWNFFQLLGLQPVAGRGFVAGEDSEGRNGVAVIGYGLWQQLFGGDSRALGTTIRVDGKPLMIVGVAPRGFGYPNHAVLWEGASYSAGNNGWETIGRLKAGVTWQQARAAFAAEAKPLAPNLPPRLISFRERLAGPAKDASLMLMAGVVLILLIACTNVANLMMARTADRAAELGIRSALGASRGRVIRQLATECLLLSFAAAIAGLVVAFWTIALAASVQPPPLGAQSYTIADARVLGFTAVTAIVTGLLFSVLPVLYAGRTQTLGTRGSSTLRGSRFVRELLVGAQVMLTIVLFTASISVERAFVGLMRTDRGFETHGLVTVNVALEGTTYQTAHAELAWFEQALGRVRRLPGVRSASATEFLPLYASAFLGDTFGIDGRPAARASMMVPVLSDYFQTMGGRILYGRDFSDAEVRSAAPVAVVDERFAAVFGPPRDAVGRRLTAGEDTPLRIVGVVRGMNYGSDPGIADESQVFVPADSPGGFFSTIIARVNGRAEDYLAAVRDAVRSTDPRVPVFGVKTMEQRLDDVLARPKFYRTAAGFFSSFALLLAALGIYGVVAWAVTERTQEMGVRMALGTTPGRLRGVLLRRGLLTVACAAVPGIAGAVVSGRFVANLIEGARTADPGTIAAVVLFLASVASVSTWAASRRIARMDIMAILRLE